MDVSRCQVCGGWPAQAICADCLRHHGLPRPRCLRCAAPVTTEQVNCAACAYLPLPLTATVAALDYAYPWSQLVRRFKFGAEPAWARRFGRLMRASAQQAQLFDGIDWIVPIPLTTSRLAQRGYNQAWELVKALQQPGAVADVLMKLADLPDQHKLPRQERLRNALGAFAVAPWHLPRLEGRRVLLVDDVMTTGATLSAAAQVLLGAGAATVSALVLARTPPDRD